MRRADVLQYCNLIQEEWKDRQIEKQTDRQTELQYLQQDKVFPIPRFYPISVFPDRQTDSVQYKADRQMYRQTAIQKDRQYLV